MLSEKWWDMYHKDMIIMKKEITDILALPDRLFIIHGDRTSLSAPKSMAILRRILLTRAVGNEFIKVEGLIDRYFIAAARAPET